MNTMPEVLKVLFAAFFILMGGAGVFGFKSLKREIDPVVTSTAPFTLESVEKAKACRLVALIFVGLGLAVLFLIFAASYFTGWV